MPKGIYKRHPRKSSEARVKAAKVSTVDYDGELIEEVDFYSGSGRYRMLTKEDADKIVNTIKMGNHLYIAAAMCGVHQSALTQWLLRGGQELQRVSIERRKGNEYEIRASEAAYVYLNLEISAALAQAEAVLVASIRKAGMGSPAIFDSDGNQIQREKMPQWAALAWMLERRFPERWGAKIEVSATVDIHVGADLNRLKEADKEIRAWEAEMGIKIEGDFTDEGEDNIEGVEV